MALWAGLVALIITCVAVLTGGINAAVLLRSVLELGAVIGVFALICAAEANS
jgi:hypothetical protein